MKLGKLGFYWMICLGLYEIIVLIIFVFNEILNKGWLIIVFNKIL